MKRIRRTKVVSVSMDAATLTKLRQRARRAHHGNLSAAIAEAADALARKIARDTVADELMNGHPSLTSEERRTIDAQLEEGWAHARRHARKRRAA